MKKLYFEILYKYLKDNLFVQNLKNRNTYGYTIEMPWYKQDADPIESNVIYLCIFLYLKEPTQDRIKALMVWKKGIKECDVCAGRVNVY